MKTKIITNQRQPISINSNLNRSSKIEGKNETEKKIQMLTEKLANYFKTKLSNLMAEKHYQFSNLILDISSFVRSLENSNYEIDTVIPRLENHLLNVLTKLKPDDKNNYSSESNQNKKINATENIKVDNNYKNIAYSDYHQEYIKSLPNTSAANTKGIFSPLKANNNISNNKINYQINNNVLKENSVFATKTNSKAKQKSEKTLNNPNNNNNNNINNNKNTEINQKLNKDSLSKLNTNNTDSTAENAILNTLSGKNLSKKTEKLNDLKEKALDEWAMIAKYNHLKHLEEQEKIKNFEEEKKRKVKEILDNQMKEKDLLKKLKEEEDIKFFKIQAEKINDLEKDFFEKEKLKIEKVKMQKELQEKFIKEAQDLKSERKKTDKIKDKIILEKIKHDFISEEERLLAKKKSEREMYLNTIKENEVKVELKKRQKELEKLENKKALDDYSSLIEKQDKERVKNLQNKIVKSNSDFEVQDFKARKQEEMQKLFEEQKFLKEKEELEIKKRSLEDSLKYKKQTQINEIKSALRIQIEEKKRIELRNKFEDEKYNQIIKSNVKKFVDEKEDEIKTYQSKLIGYKELLDHQLQEKGNKKYQMDEKEKLLNKGLIGKIYSEYVE